MSYNVTTLALLDVNRLVPLRFSRFITKKKDIFFELCLLTNLCAASAVPPVAIRSSTMSILSFVVMAFFCI